MNINGQAVINGQGAVNGGRVINGNRGAAAASPNAPTDLVAVQNGGAEGRVDLSWVSNSSDETGFSIERSYHDNVGFAEIDTVSAGESTYSDMSAGSGYYYYRVRAFNPSGYSDYTNEEDLPVYWELDEFITPDAAPIANPRTMEPGPGSLVTMADSASHGSVFGGELLSDGGAVANTDPLYVGAGRVRTVGTAFGISFRQIADVNSFLGWRTAQSGANTTFRGAFRIVSTQVYQFNNGVFTFSGLPFSLSTTYQLVSVLLPSGTAMYIKGGSFAEWVLVWVDRVDSTATMYPGIARATAAGNHLHDNWAVCQLGEPFDGAYSMADVAITGAVPSGQSFVHATNFVGYIVITALPDAGQEILLKFNIRDATNYWAIVVASTGTMTLREVVAGVETTQGTAAAAVTTGERIGVRRATATSNIFAYDTTSTNPLITKGSAGSFIAETDGEVVVGAGGSVSNLEIHSTVSPTVIQDELDRFFG